MKSLSLSTVTTFLAVFVLALAGIALADGASADGDVAVAGNDIAFSTCGADSKAGVVEIVRNSGAGTYANGESLTVTATITDNSSGAVTSVLASPVNNVPDTWSTTPTTGSDPARHFKVADITTAITAAAANGSHTVEWTVLGNTSNVSKTDSFDVVINRTCGSDPVITYGASFLDPVDGSGVINVVKQGRNVPVKVEIFKYTDSVKGDEMKTGTVTFTQNKSTDCTARSAITDLVSESTGNSTPGSVFHWTEEAGEDYWQFNLATRKLSECLNFDIWYGSAHAGSFILNVT